MSHRVLIVDDEAGIRQALKQVLEYEELEVRVAASGGEAITVYSEFRPHLVFLDVKMAGLDGLETLTRLRDLDPRAQIVMISGHGTIATAVEATQRGAFDFLEKPLDTDRLLLTVRNALAHARAGGRERTPARGHREPLPDGGHESRARGGARADRQGGAHRRAGAHHRRERHRQGAGRPRAARGVAPARPGVRRGELRRDPVGADRERAVRAHEGLVHRRLRRSGREVRAGRRRHAVSRRSRRHVALRAGQAAAGAAGGRRHPDRRLQADRRWTCGCSPPPTRISRARSRRGDSGRTCSTGSTSCRSRCRRSGSGWRTSRALVAHFAERARPSAGVPGKKFADDAVARLQARVLAGQHPRAPERGRAGADPGAGQGGDRRPTSTGSCPAGTAALPLGGRGRTGPRPSRRFKQEAEKSFLAQQLREHDWNVSETARALKMPRSNLYKKIERYGLTREST